MADLNQIVNFGPPANTCFADGRSIDSRICLNLDIIFQHNLSCLSDFVVARILSLRETKSVRPNHDSVLQDDVASNFAVLTN